MIMRVRQGLALALVLALGACGGPVARRSSGDAAVVGMGDAAWPADAGARQDAAEPLDGASEDAAARGAELVPVLVAQGHLGRTLRSCDAGRTWLDDTDHDEGTTCAAAPEGIGQGACDHHTWSPMGIAHQAPYVYALWGHTVPGSGRVTRSRDGAHWELAGGELERSYGGIAAGGGALFLAGRTGLVSRDEGATFEEVATGSAVLNTRGAAYVNVGGEGLFVMTASNATGNDILVSRDARTWTRPVELPPRCGERVGSSIVAGGETLVLVGNGYLCVSSDAGATFTLVDVGVGNVVWNGSSFVGWTRGVGRRTSDDGLAWTTEPLPTEVPLGPAAYVAETDTYVMISGDYDAQEARTSADGLTWELVEGFPTGHRIRHLRTVPLPRASCSE